MVLVLLFDKLIPFDEDIFGSRAFFVRGIQTNYCFACR